jgi:pimeloyl-ACP methyl ester carboxylesterase
MSDTDAPLPPFAVALRVNDQASEGGYLRLQGTAEQLQLSYDSAVTASTTPPSSAWPGELVAVPGGEVFVRHRTDGPPALGAPVAVLVHGLGGSSLNWYELVRLLGDAVDAFAVDLPGFGMSPPAKRHSLDVHAAAVIACIEAFVEARIKIRHRAGPVHVFGNSMGGLVSVLVAARRQDLVASLLLVSPAMPSVFGVPRDARLLALLTLPRVGERIMARDLAMPPEVAVRRLSYYLFGEPDLIPAEQLAIAAEERRARVAHPHAATAFLESLRSIAGAYARPRRLSAWRYAARLHIPVTVVYGGRDRLVREAASVWRAVVPQVRLAHLPTSGHVAMMERPALVADIVREHLAHVGASVADASPPHPRS